MFPPGSPRSRCGFACLLATRLTASLEGRGWDGEPTCPASLPSPPALHPLFVIKTLLFRAVLGLSQNQVEGTHPMYASTCRPSLPLSTSALQMGYLAAGKPPLLRHHHPKPTAHIAVLSWCWIVLRVCTNALDMKQNCNLQDSLLAVNPPFLSNAGPGAAGGPGRGEECVSDPFQEGICFLRGLLHESQCLLCFADEEPEGQSGALLGLPALLSRLVQAYLWFQIMTFKSL